MRAVPEPDMLDYLAALYAGHDQLEDGRDAEELERAAAMLAAMSPDHGLVKALRAKAGRMRIIAQLDTSKNLPVGDFTRC